jgi:hypothetical protein
MSIQPYLQVSTPGSWGVSVGNSPLLRLAAEPQSSDTDWLGSAASAVSSVASAALGAGTGFTDTAGITNLLNQQIRIQQVMQTVSMASNVARSQHETEMAPIRNMRVG